MRRKTTDDGLWVVGRLPSVVLARAAHSWRRVGRVAWPARQARGSAAAVHATPAALGRSPTRPIAAPSSNGRSAPRWYSDSRCTSCQLPVVRCPLLVLQRTTDNRQLTAWCTGREASQTPPPYGRKANQDSHDPSVGRTKNRVPFGRTKNNASSLLFFVHCSLFLAPT